MECPDKLTIGPAPPERVQQALWLVLGEMPQEDRSAATRLLLDETRRGGPSLDGLLEARRCRRSVGAVLFQVQAGGIAVVWPPRLVRGEPLDTAESLLDAATTRLAEKPVAAAHVLLPQVTQSDDRLLRGAGFAPVAELLYLAICCESFPSSAPAGPLEFEAYGEARHGRLARVVEATYRDTLDCPGLDDGRPIEDILAGYRATGVFSPDRWLIVRHDRRDVGCLLLADHPTAENMELVYMGLVPSARGHGWGTQIARHAQWLAGEAGRRRLVLAVDAANGPALRSYGAAGFEAWDRRQVYFRRFRMRK